MYVTSIIFIFSIEYFSCALCTLNTPTFFSTKKTKILYFLLLITPNKKNKKLWKMMEKDNNAILGHQECQFETNKAQYYVLCIKCKCCMARTTIGPSPLFFERKLTPHHLPTTTST